MVTDFLIVSMHDVLRLENRFSDPPALAPKPLNSALIPKLRSFSWLSRIFSPASTYLWY